METGIKSKVVCGSIIPALRIVTGDPDIFGNIKAEDYPTLCKLRFLAYRDCTTITLVGEGDKNLLSSEVNFLYRNFTDYLQLVDGLPVLSFAEDLPIFRMKSTIDGALASIELIDFDPFERAR